ncbi:tannase/feruloyl esterase family alpha/beta hydrolase [Herbaspirillum huttiense]|uniref:tannase/feruloyl esterase family alpha/beta hydrolase n=1 Tax=Herbaspirillum huttiense TaxID=863372 RepID=UPI00196A8149|nr:tannase/feruloyl esterase family alpha/beta hydrolase [Herbaspirillum huttiense]
MPRTTRRPMLYPALLSPCLIALLAACSSAPEKPVTDTPVSTPQSCTALRTFTLPAAAIGLPTRGARVTAIESVVASGDGAKAVGAYCKVSGEISPVDPAAPAIRFQVDLPAQWNGKALMFGGGGYDGTIPDVAANVPAGAATQPGPLGRGYATFASDSGHQANATTSRDGSFGSNDEALRNFAGDALKKTRDAALAIVTAHYGQRPARVYFAGGSTGGREALAMASRWPSDVDGVIALYPAWNAVALNLQFGRMTQAMAQPGAYPDAAKRKLLFDAAMAACDRLDGVADGVISNVDACNARFDPATASLNGKPLRCEGGGEGGDGCLSDAQIAAFKVFSTPLELPYPLASGETRYPGFNTWGTDWGMGTGSPFQAIIQTLGLGTEQPANPMPGVSSKGSPPYHSTFWDQWVRYFVTRDVNFNPLALDPLRPGGYQARVVALNGLQDVNQTDLSAFRNKGGKILIAHGTADALVSTQATRQYLGRLQKTMGEQQLEGFVRYYEIPGYGHVFGTAFNASWDSLTALEQWVEQGKAPVDQIVVDTTVVPGRSRPLCRYPAWPQYRGSGSVNEAGSFVCVGR